VLPSSSVPTLRHLAWLGPSSPSMCPLAAVVWNSCSPSYELIPPIRLKYQPTDLPGGLIVRRCQGYKWAFHLRRSHQITMLCYQCLRILKNIILSLCQRGLGELQVVGVSQQLIFEVNSGIIAIVSTLWVDDIDARKIC
jgi:hypothetical protein